MEEIVASKAKVVEMWVSWIAGILFPANKVPRYLGTG